MGQHFLSDYQALGEIIQALYERQRNYGEFQVGEKIVLEKEENGLWHCYFECHA